MAEEYSQFHRVQISRAQNFIRTHFSAELNLDDIAQEAGISKYHFIRVFAAYTGETPFQYIQRLKIIKALSLLTEELSISALSFEVGFESQSSFNKAFKKLSGLSPKEFRNLGKDDRQALQYALSVSAKQKEHAMNLQLSEKPEIVLRPKTEIFVLKGQGGSFTEIAPLVWQNFLNLVRQQGDQDLSRSEYLGISHIDAVEKIDNHIYKVAISNPAGRDLFFKSPMEKDFLPEQKYLKFILKGSYVGVWPAFDRIFKYVSENSYQLASAPCLENYINDPSKTPESELLTELLVPIK